MTVRRSFLTYSQLSVWRSLEGLEEDQLGVAMLTKEWGVPAGVTIEEVSAALAALSARHDALRTRFEFDHVDEPRQVLPDGPPPMPWEITDEAADGSPCEVAGAIELPQGPAWRAAILLDAGVPVRVVLSVHHLIADRAAIEVLRHDFLSLLRGTALPPAPSPFDLADLQRSAAWENRQQRAIQQWVDAVTAVPPASAPPAGGVPRWASLRSVPALTGAALLAEGTRTSVPTVVLGAYCRLLAKRGAGSCFAVGLLAGNRTGSRWRSLVGTMAQLVPMLYRHDETASLAGTARQVHQVAIEAYSNGSYDVDEAAAALAEHGVDVLGEGLAAFINWITAAPGPPPAPAFDSGDPGAWLVETSETGQDNGVARFLRASAAGSLLLRLQERLPDSSFDSMADDLTWLHHSLSEGSVYPQ